jgi:DNA-directed RNA polymerase specialized sigma24 family protein
MSVVEEELIQGLACGDKRLQERFFRALSDEWRPKIRRLLQNPGAEEVDDLLSEALLALCLPTPERPRPRVLAPPEAQNTKAWRAKVLRNFVLDRLRHRGLRAHVEAYAGRDVDAEVAKEAWRRRKQGAEVVSPPQAPVAEPRVEGEDTLPSLITLKEQRALVIQHAKALVIRRRVILLLAIDADPSPFAEELSAELHEAVTATLQRVELALKSPVEEPPSLPRVRVPWPVEPEAKARESARKALERAVSGLRAALGGREARP